MRAGAGFSLIEVIVSVAILGIAIFGLTEGMTGALRSSKDNELTSVAALYASGKIETLRAEGELVDGQTEGDCGDVLPLYRWKQTVTRSSLEGLHEVAVEVENSRTGVSIYELKTLVFEAPEEPPTRGNDRRKPETSRSRRREASR